MVYDERTDRDTSFRGTDLLTVPRGTQNLESFCFNSFDERKSSHNHLLSLYSRYG